MRNLGTQNHWFEVYYHKVGSKLTYSTCHGADCADLIITAKHGNHVKLAIDTGGGRAHVNVAKVRNGEELWTNKTEGMWLTANLVENDIIELSVRDAPHLFIGAVEE